jgi:hypothetical protein
MKKRPSKDAVKHGWLSPQGKFYKVLYGEHIKKAYEIIDEFFPDAEQATLLTWGDPGRYINAERFLENQGWLKLASGDWFWKPEHSTIELTQSQLDYVFDWCRKNEKEYPPNYLQIALEQ